ncbi:MAG: hypothetical protein U0935_22395 [Pirellulales bacterium]
MATFDESGMTFGPFSEGECFRIEESTAYRPIQDGVKIAEFALLRKSKTVVWIVEAKRSSPRPENQQDFQTFVSEIRDKLANALELLVSLWIGRHEETRNDLPQAFREIELKHVGFRLVLVINGHRKEEHSLLQESVQVHYDPSYGFGRSGEPLSLPSITRGTRPSG